MCTNHIFLFLAEILANKKKQYSDLARQINTTKVDIDKSRTKLEELKEEREANGPQYNEDGDVIISEEEFLEVYRPGYSVLCLFVTHITSSLLNFLARRDEFLESYCCTVGVCVHKNFNLDYNLLTTIGSYRAFIFHMCVPCDKTFPWVPKFLT